MPQFKFYINDEERKDLINYILSKGTKIIPDLLYNTDNYVNLANTSEFFDYLNKEQVGFFLLDDSFKIEALTMPRNRFTEEPKYAIYQRKGGPYIDASFYLGYADDAILHYKCCILEHYARFIHLDSSEEFYATEALKSYYNDLVIYIKSKCKLVKKAGKSFWISKQVLAENPHLLD